MSNSTRATRASGRPLVFAKFADLQTVRQVHLWMRQQRLPLPVTQYGPDGRKVVWKLPVYNTLHHMLTNPIYAGAYVFGRTGSGITIEAGRKRIGLANRARERTLWLRFGRAGTSREAALSNSTATERTD